VELEGVAGFRAFDVNGASEDVTTGASFFYFVLDGGEGRGNLIFGDAQAAVLGGGAGEGFDLDAVAGTNGEYGFGGGGIIANDYGLGIGFQGEVGGVDGEGCKKRHRNYQVHMQL
jgi:hypothetical protein